MIYAIGIIGVVGFIFFLLWRLEKAKHEKTRLGKELAEQGREALREIVKLERDLRDASDVDREAIRTRITVVEARIKKAEEGSVIEDVFGTGGNSNKEGPG